LPLRPITVLQALGKGAKMDAIVRDATELGASRIVPVLAERSVRRSAAERHPEDRWQRIAVEAARQCGRSTAPAVERIAPLDAALAHYAPAEHGGIGLCLDPESARPAREALAELPPAAPVVLLIGPEGGLTGAEMDAAAERGFARVTLGPFVLRTETVCAALLGALLVLEG
jgi:16S rRNA (uracil1498-N3)-methyltransferase